MATIVLQTEFEKRKGIRYQFDSADLPIGEGGMGKVYKGVCVNERNGSTRPVAIKFMFDDLPSSAYERARREAEIQLRNDNLVEMLGFIETYEQLQIGEVRKHYHVVSELLTGVSLSDIFEGKTKDRDGFDIPFAVKMLQDYKNDPEHFAKTIVMNVLSGLMALHDAGYIHRDIDPSNIMLTTDGHIKLIDFGIAKQMNNLTTGDKALTVAGKFMGKPEYAAPELALGDIAHQNQTTDIYAVGILLYQCILGHTPFEGARHEILEQQIKSKMPLGKIKNKAYKRIIEIACEKKQELRYQSSAQMRVALETMNVSKHPVSVKGRNLMIVAVFVFLVVLIGIVFMVRHKQEVADKEVEKALVEQKKTEANSKLRSKILEADRMLKIGLSKEDEDSYEKILMNAYAFYSEAESMALKSGVSEISVKEIQNKKAEVMCALDSAEVELGNQATILSEMDEVELAGLYKQRIQAITEFKKKQK